MPKLLTIRQFCDCYNISRSTLYRLSREGVIAFVHIGRAVRIDRDQAESWYASLIGAANDND